jgi:predicted DNA-binding transcriptional regulator AlpA
MIETQKRYITINEASELYSVSKDWLYRTNRIPKVHIGSRMVRIEVAVLDAYFKRHEV